MYTFLAVLLFVLGTVTGHLLARLQLERAPRRIVPPPAVPKPLSRVSDLAVKKWTRVPAPDKNKKNP